MSNLFGHLSKQERPRVFVTLLLFAVTLLISWWGLFSKGNSESTKLKDRTLALELLLGNATPPEDKAEYAKWSKAFARNVFFYLYDRNPDTNNLADQDALDSLRSRFEPSVQSLPSERGGRISTLLEEASRTIVREQYPVLRNRIPLLCWAGWGVVYWFVIFSLYACGLKPANGEPVFNVLDVGFLATLIEYSGGLDSIFMIVFSFSLALSAADFIYQQDHSKHVPYRRAYLILGPYCLALLLNIFWSVSDEVMLSHLPIWAYLSLWARDIVAGILIWFGVYAFLKLRKHSEQQQSNPVRGPT